MTSPGVARLVSDGTWSPRAAAEETGPRGQEGSAPHFKFTRRQARRLGYGGQRPSAGKGRPRTPKLGNANGSVHHRTPTSAPTRRLLKRRQAAGGVSPRRDRGQPSHRDACTGKGETTAHALSPAQVAQPSARNDPVGLGRTQTRPTSTRPRSSTHAPTYPLPAVQTSFLSYKRPPRTAVLGRAPTCPRSVCLSLSLSHTHTHTYTQDAERRPPHVPDPVLPSALPLARAAPGSRPTPRRSGPAASPHLRTPRPLTTRAAPPEPTLRHDPAPPQAHDPSRPREASSGIHTES